MGRTVDFNSKTQNFAVKIHDELVDRALPVKIIAHHLFSFELSPKDNFSLVYVLSELTGAFFEFGIVGNDGMLHGLRMPGNPPRCPSLEEIRF